MGLAKKISIRSATENDKVYGNSATGTALVDGSSVNLNQIYDSSTGVIFPQHDNSNLSGGYAKFSNRPATNSTQYIYLENRHDNSGTPIVFTGGKCIIEFHGLGF